MSSHFVLCAGRSPMSTAVGGPSFSAWPHRENGGKQKGSQAGRGSFFGKSRNRVSSVLTTRRCSRHDPLANDEHRSVSWRRDYSCIVSNSTPNGVLMRRRCRAGRNVGSRNGSVAGLSLLVSRGSDLRLWLAPGLPTLALSLCFLGNSARLRAKCPMTAGMEGFGLRASGFRGRTRSLKPEA